MLSRRMRTTPLPQRSGPVPQAGGRVSRHFDVGPQGSGSSLPLSVRLAAFSDSQASVRAACRPVPAARRCGPDPLEVAPWDGRTRRERWRCRSRGQSFTEWGRSGGACDGSECGDGEVGECSGGGDGDGSGGSVDVEVHAGLEVGEDAGDSSACLDEWFGGCDWCSVCLVPDGLGDFGWGCLVGVGLVDGCECGCCLVCEVVEVGDGVWVVEVVEGSAAGVVGVGFELVVEGVAVQGADCVAFAGKSGCVCCGCLC